MVYLINKEKFELKNLLLVDTLLKKKLLKMDFAHILYKISSTFSFYTVILT